MAKTVTYDTLKAEGTNLWVDESTGAVRMETHFLLVASQSGETMHRSKDTSYLLDAPFDTGTLPATPTRRDVVRQLSRGMQADLAAEELV